MTSVCSLLLLLPSPFYFPSLSLSFFFSLSPNRHYASIPIKLGVFAIEWTQSCSLMK